MNFLIKTTVSLLFIASVSVAQTDNPQKSKISQLKKDQGAAPSSKEPAKKGTGVKNKIAVSDPAQPAEKGAKKGSKKENGAVNK